MAEESFARRWSRRKVEERQDNADPPDDETTELAPTPEPALPEEEPPDLPPIESLTAESDFTPFLRDKVPEALRKAALRKLWRSDPVLANLDGLNDYDEDFTGGSLGGIVATAYRVGKGMIDKATEIAEETAPEADPVTEDDEAEPAEDTA
jgi:hypothetical protein